jgi:hypothetical protein
VLPGLILAAIWASAWLRNLAAQGGGDHTRPARATSSVVASCCAASLFISATLTNLDLGYTTGPGRHLSAPGMAFRRIGTGEPAAVDQRCAAIGPDASAVILDSLTADRFGHADLPPGPAPRPPDPGGTAGPGRHRRRPLRRARRAGP